MEIEFLLPARGGRRLVRVLAQDAVPVVRRPGPAIGPAPALRDHDPEELAFYSTATADIEYAFPFGTSELEGIAHRGNYDLSQHIKFSGKDLSYFDEEKKERFVPHVVVRSAGADRATTRLPLRGVHRGPGGRRGADGAEVPPEDRAPVKATVFPAGEAATACPRRPRRSTAT